jgi:hypothetical protein
MVLPNAPLAFDARALVAGWFSWEGGHATAGDLLARDVLCDWLVSAGISYDVALAPPFRGGVDLRDCSSQDYPLVFFVCGPFSKNTWEVEFLGRFSNSYICGINVSLPIALDEWNPFDYLLERNSSRQARADLSFATSQALVPVIGLCLVEPYTPGRVPVANEAIERLLGAQEVSIVPIDTRLDVNSAGLRTKAEVESVFAKMDAVVTTRLHGMVLSLKNGVPALVIDPEPAGNRLLHQAQAIGWPIIFTVDTLNDKVLQDALHFCLSNEARLLAHECADRARKEVAILRSQFLAEIRHAQTPSPKRFERHAFWQGWTRRSRFKRLLQAAMPWRW